MCYINMRKSIDLELRLSGIVMCEWRYWLIRQEDIMPVVFKDVKGICSVKCRQQPRVLGMVWFETGHRLYGRNRTLFRTGGYK